MAIELDEFGQWKRDIDSMMTTVYDDMEAGLRKDLQKFLDIYGSCSLAIPMCSDRFLDYIFNRTHEFKDPEKAEIKASLARKILLELKGESVALKDC